MHVRRRFGDALSLAQECGLFGIAFNEMDLDAGSTRKGAGDHQARKSATRAEVDPDARVRPEVEKLEGIGDVPRPQMRNRGWRDETGGPLPRQQKSHKPIEERPGL